MHFYCISDRFAHRKIAACAAASAALLLGACAQFRNPNVITSPKAVTGVTAPEPTPEEAALPEKIRIDPMAVYPGDKIAPAPPKKGKLEQIDCKVGEEDLHARMAVEARAGQIVSFAYYSKWKPRTCSIHMQRTTPFAKWKQTPDGATRVQSPNGMFVVRTKADAYEFEFFDVERMKFCGMMGYINGTMTVKRKASPAECNVIGVMDR